MQQCLLLLVYTHTQPFQWPSTGFEWISQLCQRFAGWRPLLLIKQLCQSTENNFQLSNKQLRGGWTWQREQ